MDLKETRFKKGLTQYDISKNSGVHQSRISLIERGYVFPTLKERRKIAKALDIGIEDIDWNEKSKVSE